MFNFFKKTIADEANEFNKQLKICKVVVFTYLEYSFKGHLEKKDFRSAIPEGVGESTLASEVLKYLLPIGDNKISPSIEKLSEEERESIKYNIPKWADHIMQGDEFANLIIDTLNMYGVYQGYAYHQSKDGIWAVETEEGKKVIDILKKYAKKGRENPTPKSYNKEIKKWMRWSDAINENNYKEYFKF